MWSTTMTKGRLEAFSDGVLAIILTIMVLEMKVPQGDTTDALIPLIPVFFSYVMSFIYVGIYWNNHHHMFQLVTRVNGRILLANLHLLFWLSLIPFVTGWMGVNRFASIPTAFYGCILLLSSAAWLILQTTIVAEEGQGSAFQAAIGHDLKGKMSFLLYCVGIGLALVSGWLALAIYSAVALIWLIPDLRFERRKSDIAESRHP